MSVPVANVSEGTMIPTLTKTPTTRQLVQYAGASGDFYEIHYDQALAREAGLPNVIVHGALKSAFLAQMLTDWIGGEGVLRKLSVQYRGMDVVGEAMTCGGIVTAITDEHGLRIIECDIWTENPEGKRTTVGTAVVELRI